MTKPARRVVPRKLSLLSSVALAAGGVTLAPALPPAAHLSAAYAEEAGEAGEIGAVTATAEAGEAGEAGESGIVDDGTAGFAQMLNLYEATLRITAALSAEGKTDLADEHLESSHHGEYDDLEAELEEYGAPEFEEAAEDFAELIEDRADPDAVAAALAQVLQGIEAARAAAALSPRDEVLALARLAESAASDYDGGVDEDGTILSDQEYRDAWGFVETVRIHAERLAGAEDAAIAKAGADVLEQLEPVKSLFPGLTPEKAGGDTGALHAAAAWIEIIALRLD